MKFIRDELKARKEMPNLGGCYLRTEGVRVHNEDLRNRQEEWDAGALVDVESFADGALRLTGSHNAKISNTTGSDEFDDTNIANGGRWALTDTPVVAWELSDSIGADAMLRRVGLYLNRRRNSANAPFDGTFVVQLYRIARYSKNGDAAEDRWEAVPVCAPLYKSARSMTADDELVSWTLDVTGADATIPQQFPLGASFRPNRFAVGTLPAPIVAFSGRVLVAQLYTLGGSNTNYAWNYNAAGANQQATGGAGTLHHFELTDADVSGDSFLGISGLTIAAVLGTGMPRITFTIGSYPASGTVTFTDIDLGAAPSGDVEFVVDKHVPIGTTVLVEASDDGGVSWETVVDGQSPADAGLTAQQTYRMRATLSANAAQDVTPTLRAIGVRDRTSQDWSKLATWSGEHESIDPLTGKTSIADASLALALTGVRDYQGLERFLADSNPSTMQVRRYIAHADLDREYWMFDSLWDVAAHRLDPHQAVLRLVSPLHRLRGRVPEASGTVNGYILKATDSDLTGGADWNKEASEKAGSSGTLSTTIAGSATEVQHAYTPAGVPNFLQFPDGDWTQKVEVTTANSNIHLKIRLARVNSSGTIQGDPTEYTEETQLSSTGIKTFSFLDVVWPAGAAGDRIRVDYSFRNADAGSQAVVIRTGTVDTELLTPWLPRSQAVPESYNLATIDAAFEDVRDSLIGLPERYRGNLPGNTTDKISKEVFAEDGLDLLSQIAFADGQAVIASQGLIKCVNLHKPKGVSVAGFPFKEAAIETIDSGLDRRVPEFYVPCRFDGAKFVTEVKTVHAASLSAYGAPTLQTADPRYPDEAAKWLPNETLASRIGKWVVTTHGIGQIIAEGVHVTYAYPELELGDVVQLQTDRLAFYDPVSARGIRGMLWCLAVIVQKFGPWGRRFTLWIPSPTDLYASTQSTDRRDPYEPIRVGITERPAGDRRTVAQVTLKASAAGATIYYHYRDAGDDPLDFGDHEWETYTADSILELQRDQTDVKYLDVYAQANNLRSAIVHFPIQPDKTATIDNLVGSYDAGSTVTASVSGVDGDTRKLIYYSRKGASWPTVDGTETGQPSETYRRKEAYVSEDGAFSCAHSDSYVSTNLSKWVVVPVDNRGNWGTRKTLDYTVPASATPYLSAISWALDTAGTYDTVKRKYDFAWTPAGGMSDVTDEVKIYQVLNGERQSTAILTEGSPNSVTTANAVEVDAYPRTGYPDFVVTFEYEVLRSSTIVAAGTIPPADSFQGVIAA